MALYHFSTKPLSRSSRNTVRAIAYRAGCELYDVRTDQAFNYKDKEVQHVELLLPKDAPQWIQEIQLLMNQDRQKGVQALSDIVEAAEKRIDARVWREFEFSLHRELIKEQNIALAREFVEDQICLHGMAAQLNFHFDVDEETGEEKPHCHVTVLTRRLEETGLSAKKERGWNTKAFLLELREKWAEYSNFHLKLHGHDVQIDHRSYQEQGIEIEPQPKRGKGILEQERKANNEKTLLSEKAFATDKAKAFQDVQLRNLYRILRRPEIVFDIVTKHNATFMWADVQKKLHQYVDNTLIFQRLEAKLKNSKELILLRLEGSKKLADNNEEKAIYTTKRLLKAERVLVKTAENLGRSKSHGVTAHSIEEAILKANESEELKKHAGLSQDQLKAIHHLSQEGQIKCVVGIAGAGKTTALGVCHDIWKNSGYAVYGLAPTGKAAQNLSQNGINSTTVHKFLKSFEEGRCQYNKNSILVLDEAGMVDIERFGKLLVAVKKLGVKLIVVGDGAQLQPVEAGPAFRLITERLGKSELHTVLRQKEDWQKEATVLFGKQETRVAIQKYVEKGCIHIIEENLPSLKESMNKENAEEVVKLYEISARVSSLLYREMAKEVKQSHPQALNIHSLIKEHQDFQSYQAWKAKAKETASIILQNSETYRPLLEVRSIDPLKLLLRLDPKVSKLFINKQKDKAAQLEEAKALLKQKGLDHLIGITKARGQGVEVRQDTKQALIKDWHASFKENHEKSTLILAYSNRDINDLNRTARTLLKESGHLSTQEYTYQTKKQVEDDFGRKATLKEEKSFAKGDRIVFTRNTTGLGVKNGTMGSITTLSKQKIYVKLDEGKEISFAPNLNPYFDHGWAITIHKSQGTTADRTYLLASFEMNQNLAYVAMTRHREELKIFGSSLDFWREEKLPQILAKSGEKLSAADYLDSASLEKLMQQDDHLLTKIFERIAGELDAMRTVSKKAFWQVADHFLGKTQERPIRIDPESVREEVRAEELWQKKEHALSENKEQTKEFKAYSKAQKASSFIEAKTVEEALKQNISSFADEIFSSLGEQYHRASSSASERRYGKKGHIAVNLRTGAWIDYKDSSLSGGPLHMLTKLKGLSFKEAIEYGASWAGISQERINVKSHPSPSLAIATEKATSEEKQEEDKIKIKKAHALWEKGKPIHGTLAEQYLKEYRKIEGELPQNLRYLPSFKDRNSGKAYPCLMAAAKSTEEQVTAVQLTFLDPKTAAKAKLDVAKKSFGVLKGSSVTLQEDKACFRGLVGDSNTLFIAEGVETALSLKEAGIKGTIKASLGLSNIRRLLPTNPNMHIVICADHDEYDSPAAKSLEKSVLELQEKCFKVTVIKPDKLGQDFNDVLKAHGSEGVRKILEKVLPKEALTHGESKSTEEKATSLDKRPPKVSKASFSDIEKLCQKHLYEYLKEEKIPLTRKLKERLNLQAEKAANYIFHTHTLKGTHPSEEKTELYLRRAKYELDRIPEIRRKLLEEWRYEEGFSKKKDGLVAHMIAERKAAIEGRLYFEAIKRGLIPPEDIPYLAEKELDDHGDQTKPLAQKLFKKYSLSESAAIHCAKDVLRYQETHGKKPSEEQISIMAQVAQELEHRIYPIKKYKSYEIEFFHRKEGDLLIKLYEHNKSLTLQENEQVYKHIQASLDTTFSHIAHDFSKLAQKSFSL